jgi:dihydrofolate reductase
MLYWETAEQEQTLDEAELEWAALWNPLPKVVFSTTLSAVQGNARLASGGLAEEIERLRAEPGEGDIAIGGATLAAEAAAAGLIDEYRAMVYPVLVGGGIPFFPQRERRVDLELVETRTFSSEVVYLRYRVARCPRSRHPRSSNRPLERRGEGDPSCRTPSGSPVALSPPRSAERWVSATGVHR